MTERVVLIRHGDDPADDRVVSYFRGRNIEPEIRRPFRGEALGDVDGSVAASVVYGGPFNVFETGRHDFLNDEHRWIEQCMARDVPLLGICQGAQSIAHVLGARCGPIDGEPHEFGYYLLRPTRAGKAFFPDQLHVCESRFHEFSLPDRDRLVGSNEYSPFRVADNSHRQHKLPVHHERTDTRRRSLNLSSNSSEHSAGVAARHSQVGFARRQALASRRYKQRCFLVRRPDKQSPVQWRVLLQQALFE